MIGAESANGFIERHPLDIITIRTARFLIHNRRSQECNVRFQGIGKLHRGDRSGLKVPNITAQHTLEQSQSVPDAVFIASHEYAGPVVTALNNAGF